ncbi:MAG TPA: glutamate mutase L [Anaerolineaceae bacterium]
MMPPVEVESVLALDIGSIFTRAILFDVVDGQYRFIASGTAPSTANAPFCDISEGMHTALTNLEQVTGQTLLDDRSQLILPTRSTDGAGVDRMVITFSAGPELRLVVMGLLGEVSLDSANRLAAATYGKVVEKIALNDHRREDTQIDAIVRARPDLIILAGGTDQGASRSVLQMAEVAALACKVLPEGHRPQVIYSGNQVLAQKIKESLEGLTPTFVTPNVRPSIDFETLDAAQETLSKVVSDVRLQQLGGLASAAVMCSAPVRPTAYAFGRVMRFLSKLYDPVKGVLGVDIGSASTTLAAAYDGKLHLNVLRSYGMGSGLSGALAGLTPDEICQWLPVNLAQQTVMDYLWQKSLFPASIPMTSEALMIEQAALRALLRHAVLQLSSRLGRGEPGFEPILASGTSIVQAATPFQSLLALLDGIQPVGVTTVVLDPNNLAAPLGAIADFNSLLPVQVFDSGAFANLGTVVCPVSRARVGTPIMRIRLDYEDGNTTQMEIRQGAILRLPVSTGQTVRLQLNGLRGTLVEPRKKLSSLGFKVTGGLCGIVVDARGRPLPQPTDLKRRIDLNRQWQQMLSDRKPVKTGQ